MASRAGCGFGSAAWSASSSCASATRRYSARSVCHHPTAPTLRAPLAPCTARSPTTANSQTVLSFSLHGVCSPALTPGTAARTHGRDLDSPAYSATAQLRQLAEDPTHDVRGSPAKARLTCGFAPWLAGIVEERLFSRQHFRQNHAAGPHVPPHKRCCAGRAHLRFAADEFGGGVHQGPFLARRAPFKT